MILRDGWDFAYKAQLPEGGDWQGRGWGETFGAQFRQSGQESVLGNLLEAHIERPAFVENLVKDSTFAEMLSPDQVKQEFPEFRFSQGLKNPMLRAEAYYYREREKKEDLAFKKTYTGALPEWTAKFPAAVAAYGSDPLMWASILGGWGLISRVPAYTRLLQPLNLARKTLKSRGAAAAAIGVQAFTEDLIYNVGNYHTSKLVHRPYTTGDIFTNALIASGLGAGLGGAFPSLALRESLTLRGNVPVKVAKAAVKAEDLRLKYAESSPSTFDDKFAQFLKDEGGEINPRLLLGFLEGERPFYRDWRRRLESGEINLVGPYGPQGVEKVIPSSERRLSARTRTKRPARIPGMVEDSKGRVLELNGHVFDTPRGRFTRDSFEAREAGFRGYAHTQRLDDPNTIPTLYTAVTDHKGTHIFSNSLSLAGEWAYNLNSKLKRVVVVEASFHSNKRWLDLRGDVNLKLRDHLPRGIRFNWNIPFKNWSMAHQAQAKDYLFRVGWDGVITGVKGVPEAIMVEMPSSALSKVKKISSERGVFEIGPPKEGEVTPRFPKHLKTLDNIFVEQRAGDHATPGLFSKVAKLSEDSADDFYFRQGKNFVSFTDVMPDQLVADARQLKFKVFQDDTFETALDTMTSNKEALRFKSFLESKGFTFPEALNIDHILRSKRLLKDGVVDRVPFKLKVENALFDEGITSRGLNKDVSIDVNYRTLDLFKHPDSMSALERAVARILVQDYGFKVKFDAYEGRSNWEVKSLPTIPDLESFGITGIAFKPGNQRITAKTFRAKWSD